ncbi:hypothetical protein LCGC14_0970880 [marine sediment metagenome]|uniref:Uncharacterized protein n=1 Tax=marine sediment metagenome TaxID=412755 RepID=A0A0F9NBR9_9ZZZZ
MRRLLMWYRLFRGYENTRIISLKRALQICRGRQQTLYGKGYEERKIED